MNIFYINEDPIIAARQLCDKHVIKMQIESAQLLSTAHWLSGGAAPYKATHKNHPCSIWARSSVANYKWLVKHGIEICNEFERRYGKEHATLKHLKWLKRNIPNLPKSKFVTPPQCMPNIYKNVDCVKAYQTYYVEDKIKVKNLGWKKLNNKPEWVYI